MPRRTATVGISGTRIGGRGAIAGEHLAGPPAGDAHQVDLGAAGAEPPVGEGVLVARPQLPLERAAEVVYPRRCHRLSRGSDRQAQRRFARDVAQLGQRTCFGIISELALCYPVSLQLTHDRK
jgi:hypothetical protein